jgi:hypothetical protein
VHRFKILAVVLVVGAVSTAVAWSSTSRSGTSHLASTPYLVRMFDKIEFKQFLTVGDSVPKAGGGDYRMVGVPDGLGAYDNGDGTFTLLVNHELTNTIGIPRAHGGRGAFVSRWVVNKKDLKVVSGGDLIKTVNKWQPDGQYAAVSNYAFSRFCSADLAPLAAFYNATTKKGYDGRLLLNGEESGAEGPAWAHEMNGVSWELPFMGNSSWENLLANPATGDKTVVIGQDDQGGDRGQVYVYVGDKQESGTPPVRAGLNGGSLYGVKVASTAFEPTAAAGLAAPTSFSLYKFGDASRMTGAQLETSSNLNQVTQFQRPEDGAWDPTDPNVYYFATTDQFRGNSRLWKLTFKDVKNTPEAGGTIEMLLAGAEGQQMFDNIAVDKTGTRIILLEDIGSERARGKVWKYVLANDTLSDVAEHNPTFFEPGESGFITQDEETSGVIDMTDILGRGWVLMSDQVHLPTAPAGFKAPPAATTFPYNDPELVEGGALIAAYFPMWGKKPAS